MINVTRFDPRRLAVSAAALLGVGLLVWQGLVWLDDTRADDRRDAAVAVAKAQVLDLTTMNSSTVEQNLDAMGKRLSGDFKRQFDGFAKTFAEAVTDAKIRATGDVDGAALSEYDENSATVIVASTAQVEAGKDEKAVERHWRFKVLLDRADDEWLISGMEFVQ